MPERLRDLIVQQRSAGSQRATALGQLAQEMASDRLRSETRTDFSEALLKTKQDIFAEASKALLAQATHTQDSVLALLKTG